MRYPLTILWIAIPLFVQTIIIFGVTYFVLARLLKLSYRDAAPAAITGASNHFEVAIATATMLFGLSSGAALATVVGVLIEVPVMLMLVKICLRTQHWFGKTHMPGGKETEMSTIKKKVMKKTILTTLILGMLSAGTAQALPANARVAIEKASKAEMFLFLIFYEAKDASFTSLSGVMKEFKKSSEKKISSYAAKASDLANREIIEKYGIRSSDLPVLLVIAPNGAITGGYSKTATADQLKQSVVVSDLMLKTLKPLQEQKIVLVSLQNASTKFNKETKNAVNDFSSDPQYKQFVTVVNADPIAPGSREFMNQCKITEKHSEAIIVVLLPPGRIGGVLKGNSTISKTTILGALQSCSPGGGSGCCPKK